MFNKVTLLNHTQSILIIYNLSFICNTCEIFKLNFLYPTLFY